MAIFENNKRSIYTHRIKSIMGRIKLRTFLLIFCWLPYFLVHAEDTYKLDVGIFGGGSFYLGDANSTLFKGTQPCFGAFGKYIINGRWEVALQGYGGVVNIPEWNNIPASRTTFGDISVTGEFNFFNYGKKKYDKTYSIITPYIFAGLGLTIHTYGIAPNIPFGLGIKVKATPRLNFGLAWRMHKLMTDNFDNIHDPYGLNGKGLFNNKDWFSSASLSISYNFWKDCAPCRRNHAEEYRTSRSRQK